MSNHHKLWDEYVNLLPKKKKGKKMNMSINLNHFEKNRTLGEASAGYTASSSGFIISGHRAAVVQIVLGSWNATSSL